MRHILHIFGMLVVISWGIPPAGAQSAKTASLLFAPASGEYFVGSTFDVAIVLNTAGQAANAVEADIRFPPEKLQVVNPSASTSFITLWVRQPQYSNIDGTVSFQGGVPNPGITTSDGIVSTITFRAVSSGTVSLRLTDMSKVLLNDGKGTDVLGTRGTAQFTIKIPPPKGPETVSTTHPDPNRWYQNQSASFSWTALESAQGYSYAFDQHPLTVPDERVDTKETNAVVTADSDGEWYFHIRAQTTVWGGTTHVPVKIDATAPAGFTPEVETGPPSEQVRPIVTFVTTDAISGIEHFEVRVSSLSGTDSGTPFFVEQSSPYQLPPLSPGDYEVTVRAYDHAGNATDGRTAFTLAASGALLEEPLVKTTLYTNIALIAAGTLIILFLIWLIWRRFHREKILLKGFAQLEAERHRHEVELAREIAHDQEMEQQIAHDLGEEQQKKGPPAAPNFGSS